MVGDLHATRAHRALLDAIAAFGVANSRSEPAPAELTASAPYLTTSVIGVAGGRPILLLESPPGVRLPRYAVRLATIRRLGDRVGHAVFTDSARSEYVWVTKPASARGPGAYREYRLPDRIDQLLGLTRDRSRPEAATAIPPPAGGATSGAVLVAILARIPRTSSLPPAEPAPFRQWIEGLEELETVRGALRAVGGLRILDPQAGGPDWLLEAAEALEFAFSSVLDRARSWLDDSRFDLPLRRPEHLGDLRRIVAAADDPDTGPSPEAFVRREILRRNLYAVTRIPAVARHCRRALLEYGGIPPEIGSYFDTNVRVARREIRNTLETADRDPSGSGSRQEWIAEETDLIRTAARELRQARRHGEGSPAEWLRSAVVLERRVRKIEAAAARSGELRVVPGRPTARNLAAVPVTFGGARFEIVRNVD
jgi:hypothetical protein